MGGDKDTGRAMEAPEEVWSWAVAGSKGIAESNLGRATLVSVTAMTLGVSFRPASEEGAAARPLSQE